MTALHEVRLFSLLENAKRWYLLVNFFSCIMHTIILLYCILCLSSVNVVSGMRMFSHKIPRGGYTESKSDEELKKGIAKFYDQVR